MYLHCISKECPLPSDAQIMYSTSNSGHADPLYLNLSMFSPFIWEREVTNCGFLVNLVHALQLFMVKGKHCFQSSTTHWAVASGNYCSKCWVGSGWFLVQDDFLTIYPYMVTHPTAFLSLQSFLTFYFPRKTCIFIWPLLVFLLYGGLPENWIPINKGSEESKNPHNGPTIFPF